MKKRVKDEGSKEEEIIDLNHILHSFPEETVAGTGSGQQEVGGALGNHDDSDTSGDVMDKAGGTCLYVQDDIPDDEFERMLGGVRGDVAMATDVAKGDGVNEFEESGGLLSLVVVPTRELAFQVQDHLEKAAKHTPIKVGWDQLPTAKKVMEVGLLLQPHYMHGIN